MRMGKSLKLVLILTLSLALTFGLSSFYVFAEDNNSNASNVEATQPEQDLLDTEGENEENADNEMNSDAANADSGEIVGDDEASAVQTQGSAETSASSEKIAMGGGTPGIATQEVSVAKIGSVSYETLQAAFEAASASDTIVLQEDVTLTETINVSKSVTLNLNGKTITVNITADSTTVNAFTVNEATTFTISNGSIYGTSGKDNRAIEGKANSNITLKQVIITNFAITGNGAAVYINSGTLTAEEKCSFGYYDYDKRVATKLSASNGGAIFARNSEVTIKDSRLLYNSSVDSSGSSDQYWYGGGSLFLEGGNATISGNYFFSCTTKDYGGAIHLDIVKEVKFENNKMDYCAAYNHRLAGGTSSRGGDGGTLYVRLFDKISFKGNTISNSFAMSNGGGMHVLGNSGSNFVFENSTVTKCEAGHRGGGMKLQMSEGSRLELISGLISENSATEMGGGIDYTTHNQTALRMSNVLITENEAVRGAGIWACPTSETYSYSTLGGTIYNNKASGKINASLTYGALGASGDEVRYEGKDTKDAFVVSGNKPSASTIMTVTKRALGGGLMKWYLDEEGNRYEEGDAEVESAIHTDTSDSFGLHGVLSEEHQALATAEAKLIIKGNSCTRRGGGIASNSPIIIGLEGVDVSVKVTKTWDEKEHPGSVLVDLYRVNADNSEIKLDHDVELNADNNWQVEFTDLPSKYTDSNGVVQDCTYKVKEHSVEGWASESTTSYDDSTKTYTVNIENKLIHYGDLSITKQTEGSGADADEYFDFTVTLDKEITGTYGDLEFKDGVASFKLKNGETKTARGIISGTAYKVQEKQANEGGYQTSSENEEGLISADETVSVVFTNYREANIEDDDDPVHDNSNEPGGSSSDNPSNDSSGDTPQTGDLLVSGALMVFLVLFSGTMLAVLRVARKKAAKNK